MLEHNLDQLSRNFTLQGKHLTFDESHVFRIGIVALSFLDRLPGDVDGRAEHRHVDHQHDGHGAGEGPDQTVLCRQPTSENKLVKNLARSL